MKKVYLLGLLGAFIVSCSSDDNGDNGGSNNQTGTFIPTTQGNYWVYDVTGTSLSGRDSLYVAGDTLINSTNYKKLQTKEIATGFFSNALSNNGIKQENGKIYLSGTAGLNISEELPFDIDVSNFIIFDESASENQQLSIEEGTLNQEIEGYTLTFEYKLTSKAKTAISSFTSGDEQYSNVKPVEITLNLGISIGISIGGFPINFPLMDNQDVVVSTQYYAQGIGAVKSVTDITYNLTELPNIELPIPQSGSEHQEEVLVDYNVE